VERRKDGLYITGPGTPTVSGAVLVNGDLRSALAATSGVHIYLSFGVAGIDRYVKLDAGLDCFPDKKGLSGSSPLQRKILGPRRPNRSPSISASIKG
jgi:hypothetical protein